MYCNYYKHIITSTYKMLINDILSIKPTPRNKNITDAINKMIPLTKSLKTKEIVLENKYDMIVPYNIWFMDKNYSIHTINENNQNIRCRY